jgi:Uma2 family endonuclease
MRADRAKQVMDELDEEKPIEIAPDLAVEIVSKGEYQRRLAGKLEDYASVGVPEVWVIRPKERTAEVLRLVETDYEPVGEYPAGTPLESLILPGFRMDVADILPAMKKLF